MNKVGILSLNINTDDLNHGAVLHSWAFQKYLSEHFDVQAEIIDYVTPRLQTQNMKYPVLGLLKQRKYKSAMAAAAGVRAHKKRYEKFMRFKHAHMAMSDVKYTQKKLANAQLDYDFLFCESDVIWDPHFFGESFDPTFFLALPSMKNIKRIAYSPSAGNLDFSEQQKDRFRKLIRNLQLISTRESYTAEYIRSECGRDATCVVDPVLLLQATDYAPLIGKRLIDVPYLLLYTPVGYDVSLIRQADQLAKKRGLKVIEISRYPIDFVFHKTIADPGIEEFLSLIQYADVIVSNSFHGICFSILFQKDFYAVARATGRKTEDLCGRLCIQNRYIQQELRELPLIDYDKLNAKLDELRAVSGDFIRRAFSL